MRISQRIRKILVFPLILVFVLSLASSAIAAGEWTEWRNTSDNQGTSTESGSITSPSTLWSQYICGEFDPYCFEGDVNSDSYNDLVFVEGGCVEAIDRNNSRIWRTSDILAERVYGMFDVDDNSTNELVVFCDNKLMLLNASNGNTVWTLSLSENLTEPRFKVEDLDGDGKLEFVFYVYSQSYIYCYTFKNGAANGVSMWTITDNSTGQNISDYAPGITIKDIDDNGIKEVGIVSYGAMKFYDGRSGALSVPSSTTNWAASANGGSVTVDSLYPGGGYPASNLNDGSTTTYWINNKTVPGYAILTFSANKYIKYVNLYGMQNCTAFNVQTWNGTSWNTQSTISSNTNNNVLLTLSNKVYTNKIKVNVTSSVAHDGSGIYQCQFSELQAYEELPNFNWAASANGGTSSTDSIYPGGSWPASNINDGNTSTYWINNKTVPGWIQVDFLSAKDISYVKLSGMSCCSAFNVQTWNGSSWITQKSISSNTNATRHIDFPSSVNTQKIRVNITSSVANDGQTPITYQCQFSELEAYTSSPYGEDYADSASITVDSVYYSGGYPSSNLNDGSSTTYWINNRTEPGWAKADFTDERSIQYVNLLGMSCTEDFSVQTYANSTWTTQATYTDNTDNSIYVKLSSPVSASAIKINITDSVGNDGTGNGDHCQMSEIEVLATPKDFTTSTRSASWISGGANGNGRNYGYFKLIDIDNDDIEEGVIVADGVCRHVGVVDNSKHGTQLLWDRFIEYPIVNKTMRVTGDAVCDIDGDGDIEIVYSVYDNTSSQWTIFILNAYTNAVEQSITGKYIWGLEDLNGDDLYELLVSDESSASPADSATIRVLEYNTTTKEYESAWNTTGAFIIADTGITDNTVSDADYSKTNNPLTCDLDGDGDVEIMVLESDTYKAIEYEANSTVWSTTSGQPIKIVSLLSTGTQVLTQDSDGKVRLINSSGTVLWNRDAGNPNLITPVFADLDNDSDMEMIVSDMSSTRVYDVTSSGAISLWSDDARGRINYSSGTTSAVVADIYGNSNKEIIVNGVNTSGQPTIRVLDNMGNTSWEYAFSGFGSNAIYDWQVGDFDGDGTLDVYVALLENGIDTGRTRIIDGSDQTLLWSSPDTYTVATGVTRSVGPYPGSAAVDDIDGDGKDELFMVSLDTFYRFDWNGTTMSASYTRSTDNYIYYNTPIITSVDNNSSKEVIFAAGFNKLSVYDGSVSTLKWSFACNGYEIMRRMQGIADVDNDNVKEIAIQRTNGTYAGYLYSYNGSSGLNEWSYNLSINYGTGVEARDIIAADIDGDSKKEFILTTNTGYVIAVNGEIGAGSRVCWSHNLSMALSNPVVADIDADSELEVLVFAGDGKVYAIDK